MFLFKRKALLAPEVLQETFKWLRRRSFLTIVCNTIDGFPAGALAKIANDTDPEDCRSRVGLMCYDTLELCQFADRVWVVGLGRKGGNYPGDEYSADLMAFRPDTVPPQNPTEDLTEAWQSIMAEVRDKNAYFKSSLLIALRDGKLRRANHGLDKRLEPRLADFVVEERTELAGFEIFSHKPVFGSIQLWGWKFPRFLANEIAEHLATC